MNYLRSKFKSKHDYYRVAIAVIVPVLAVYHHFGGDVEGLVTRYTQYTLAATSLVALMTRSPIDDKDTEA